ncbi:Aste57867_15325 [Aphanomyces stellatus]|uniref:Aste57867_15325 protein n=1 Tax=Aphanomyces stellatus TaxID=120398 RepID=A0A485L2W4_9STRA|nr:hypothetical protein As57867_015269 [Aphanomyces stellatus]VFT92134.1 Aste57867_15325 [Aphanomyces stellatus]
MTHHAISERVFAAAMEDVKNGMSLRKAASLHGIESHVTLASRVRAGEPFASVFGRKNTVPPKMEVAIMDEIALRSLNGRTLSTADLSDIIITTGGVLGVPLPPGFPDKRWIGRFKKRHPELTIRRTRGPPQAQSSTPAAPKRRPKREGILQMHLHPTDSGDIKQDFDFSKKACDEAQKMRRALGDHYFSALDILTDSATARSFLVIKPVDRLGWIQWKLNCRAKTLAHEARAAAAQLPTTLSHIQANV